MNSYNDWKLQYYYYIIEVFGMVLLAFFGAVIYAYPSYFLFLGNPSVTVTLLFVLLFFNTAMFMLGEIFRKKFFYSINRYGWVIFWLAVVYNSGNVNSQFIFLLIFPLLVSAVDLNSKDTKLVGIVTTTAFALMVFFEPNFSLPLLIMHLVRVLMFGVISYFVYQMVWETLEQKYQKEEAKKRSDQLIELDRVKTDFLTVAQHQLRAPLAGARWGIDNILSRSSLPQEDQSLLKDVYLKVQDAINIVNEMLKTAEMEPGRFSLTKTDFDLGAMIGSILGDFSYLLSQKFVTIHFKHAEVVKIFGDEKLVRSAISNVIDNAIRYSPRGVVSITLKQNDREAELIVKDTGIGIDREDMAYVFDRFYRGKNAISSDPNESGIGLHITKKIIEFHGGSVELKSELGKGTTVNVFLPKS